MRLTIYYTSYFRRVIRNITKTYPHLKQDMKPVIKQLQEGELLGDLIPNLSDSVYKIRVKNSDNNKGESADYQIIYYVKRQEHIILLILHSESEQADISTAEIQAIIDSGIREKAEIEL